MLFDAFTFFAQLVNFLILVWLLKRYLFKPVLDAIDAREELIANQLKDAEVSKAKAEKEMELFERKNRELDQHSQDLINKSIDEVNKHREKLLEQTRDEIEALRLRLLESLRSEQQSLGSEIMWRTRAEVFTVVRKTMEDLANVNLEEQMTRAFIRRIIEMGSVEKELLDSALKNTPNEISVRSVFELPLSLRNAIRKTIESNFNKSPEINFETASQLISGIELVTNGFKVSWNIEDYLNSLESHIAELLNQNSETITEKAL